MYIDKYICIYIQYIYICILTHICMYFIYLYICFFFIFYLSWMCVWEETSTRSNLCVIPLTSSGGLPPSFLYADLIEAELVDERELRALHGLSRAKKEPCAGPQPSAHQSTSRQGPPMCCLKRPANGGLAIIYTRFLPRFNLTEKCLEIKRTSANRPDLHDRGAESRGRKLIFREALWACDSLVAFGAL